MTKNSRAKDCVWTIVLVSLVSVSYQLAAAQQAPRNSQDNTPIDAKTTTRVALGNNSGAPGASVPIPIYFIPAEGVEVGRLQLDVTFVSVNMKFDKLDPGLAAELGKLKLASDVKLGKNDKGVETSTVTVLVSLPSDPPPDKGIRSGLLGYITLRISMTDRPAKISLHGSAEAAELESGKPLKNVRTSDAEVEILAPGQLPAIACFFFTH